ncbi:unnamed protein product, partial [marine sediment metagenome]
MPTATNALIYYEAGQSLVAMVELTDVDRKVYKSADALWSDRSGYEPDVKPNGLATGGKVTPEASETNDEVDVAGLTCYLAGVLETVGAAADQAITRSTSAVNTYRINSITVTAAPAIAVVPGADEGVGSFTEVRGDPGGPPFIDTDAIEIAQVRTADDTA